MSASATLPEYSAELAAFHRAHRPELRQIVRDLKMPGDAKVLDVACGDGVYTRWLAEEAGPHGAVIGADLSTALLKIASRDSESKCKYVAATIESLPFPTASFDIAWCAQSLVSLPAPLAVLREMRRVLRPGGRAVVLENDSLHELMLPWPEELELAIRAAQWRTYKASKRRPEKRYVGRRLSGLMRKVGFAGVSRKTYATDRVAPLSDADRFFLSHHLETLRDTVFEQLAPKYRRKLDRLVQPDSPEHLLDWPHFEMTWFDVVCMGRKPHA